MATAKEIVTTLKLDGKEFTKGLSDTQKALIGLSASATAVGASVLYAAKETAVFQDAMIKSARAAGFATEEFSGLAHAADMSGVSTEELSMNLGKLASPAGKASKGLESLGIKIKDAQGNLKGTNVLFGELADKVAGLKNPADKAAAAITVFGKSGGQMVSLLAGGSKSLEDFRKQAELLGITVSEEAGLAAEKFNDDLSLLMKSGKGLVQQFSESVIAIVNESDAFNVLREIVQSITSAWRGLDDGTKKVIVGVVLGTSAVAALGLALAGLIPLASAVLAALSPIVLIIAAISAVVIAFVVTAVKYWDQLKASIIPVQNAFKSLMTTIKQALQPIIDFFNNLQRSSSGFGSFIQQIQDATKEISILGTVANVVMKVIASAVVILVRQFQLLLLIAKEVGTSLYEIFTFNFNGSSLDRLKQTFEDIKKNITDTGSDLKQVWSGDILVKAAKDADKARESLKKMNEEIRTGAGIEDGLESIDKFRNMGIGQIGQTADDIIKVWRNKFKDGKALSFSEQITATALLGSQLLQHVGQIASQVVDVFAKQAQLLADNLKKKGQQFELFSQVYQGKLTQALQAEIDALKKAEDEKLAIIQNASNERILALDAEYQKSKDLKDKEFADFVANERAKFEAYKNNLLAQTYDNEQRILVNSQMEEDWKNYLALLEKKHGDETSDLQKQYSEKQKEETKNTNDALAAEKDRSDAIIAKKEADKAAKEKQASKKSAFFKWQIETAAFLATKNIQATQTLVAGIAGAAQAFATTVGTLGPFGLPVAAVISGLVLTTAIQAASAVRATPPPLPPAELFMATGGVLAGPSHSQGGIAVNAEGGEGVIDKVRTSKLMQVADSITQTGGGGTTIIFQSGAIQNNGPMDDAAMDRLGLALARRLERQGVGQAA